MQKRILIAGLLFGVGLAFGGCSGDDDSPRHHKRDQESMGPPPPAKPVMHGRETFFNGKIMVEASLGQGVHHGGGGSDDESGHSGGGGGGGQHGHRGGGGGGAGGQGGGGGYLGGDNGGSGQRPLNESSMPPVTLSLHVTNSSDAPIDVAFEGCDSTLGNFVITPEKLTIPAGQGVDTDPMRSLLGVTADEIPVEITLQVAGKTEKKTITLHLDLPPPTTMTEASPPPPADAPAPMTPPPSTAPAP